MPVIVYAVAIGLPIFGGLVVALALAPRHWPWDVFSERDRISRELPGAVAQWDKLHSEDYDIDAQMWEPPYCFADLTLQVRHGVLIGIIEHERDSQADRRTGKTTEVPQIHESFYTHICQVETLIPPKLLDRVKGYQDTRDPAATFLFARFNAEFGFVEELRVEANDPGMGDCCSRYTFSNFQPISATN